MLHDVSFTQHQAVVKSSCSVICHRPKLISVGHRLASTCADVLMTLPCRKARIDAGKWSSHSNFAFLHHSMCAMLSAVPQKLAAHTMQVKMTKS